MEKISLKEQLKEKLESKGTLTSEDLAAAQAETEAGVAKPQDSMDIATNAKVGDSQMDALLQEAKDSSTNESVAAAMLERSEVPDDQFGLIDEMDEVVITPQDKRRFVDSFVDGSRFTRGFSILGGRITGMFRCRTAGESRAIIEELARQGSVLKETVYENAVKMRYALLHCQLAEFNHVARPEWKEPLMAVQKIDVVAGKVFSETPVWYQEMQLLYDKKMDGMVNALYAELKKFDKVYWLLVKNTANQDFWLPGDSITE